MTLGAGAGALGREAGAEKSGRERLSGGALRVTVGALEGCENSRCVAEGREKAGRSLAALTLELGVSGLGDSIGRLVGRATGAADSVCGLDPFLRPMTTTEDEGRLGSLGEGAVTCGGAGLGATGSFTRSVPRTIKGATAPLRSELRPATAAEFSAGLAVGGLATGLEAGTSMGLARGSVLVVATDDPWAATDSRGCGAVAAGRETGDSTTSPVRSLVGAVGAGLCPCSREGVAGLWSSCFSVRLTAGGSV